MLQARQGKKIPASTSVRCCMTADRKACRDSAKTQQLIKAKPRPQAICICGKDSWRRTAAHVDSAGTADAGARGDLCRSGRGKRMYCRISCFLLTQPSSEKPTWGCRRSCYPSAQSCSEAKLLQLGGKPYSPSSYNFVIDMHPSRRLKTACIAHLPECC